MLAAGTVRARRVAGAGAERSRRGGSTSVWTIVGKSSNSRGARTSTGGIQFRFFVQHDKILFGHGASVGVVEMHFGIHQAIGGVVVDAGVHFQHCRMGQTVVDIFGGQFFASTVVDVIVDQGGVVAHARCVETSFLGACLHTLVVVVFVLSVVR